MSEHQPVDKEATAASVLNGVMFAVIGLLVSLFGLWTLVERLAAPGAILNFGWASDWRVISALSATVVGCRCVWFASTDLRRLPVRTRPPSDEEGQLSRRELIRRAPWVDKLPDFSVRSTIKAIVTVAIVVGLAALAWRLPEPQRSWTFWGFMALMLAIRLVEWAWRHFQRAR